MSAERAVCAWGDTRSTTICEQKLLVMVLVVLEMHDSNDVLDNKGCSFEEDVVVLEKKFMVIYKLASGSKLVCVVLFDQDIIFLCHGGWRSTIWEWNLIVFPEANTKSLKEAEWRSTKRILKPCVLQCGEAHNELV